MPEAAELTGIAFVAVGALVCGIIVTRLRQPAVVGYIFAGVLLGPSGLAFVENRDRIVLLAELGVLLLLFLIGMELSLRGFARVWRVALMATALQVAISVGIVVALAQLFDWSLALTLLIAFALSLSSTAVAIKILQDIGELRTGAGRTAVGVLIAQDLAVVPMLLVIDGLAEGGAISLATVIKIVVAIAFLALLIRFFSGRRRLRLPFAGAIGDHIDLTPLTALAYCFAAAAVSGVLGLSPAYGAFLAGLLIGNSTQRATVHAATQPIQSVLLMVFFLSIGLLIDLAFIWRNLTVVLALLLFVVAFKSAMNVGVLHLLGEPWHRAFLSGVVLAQIGEFSFVLLAAGAGSGIVDGDGYRLFVAIIALNLALSPLWLNAARRLHALASHSVPTLGALLEELYGHEAAVVGEGSSRLVDAVRRGGGGVRRSLAAIVSRARGARRPAVEAAAETPALPAPSKAPSRGRGKRRGGAGGGAAKKGAATGAAAGTAKPRRARKGARARANASGKPRARSRKREPKPE